MSDEEASRSAIPNMLLWSSSCSSTLGMMGPWGISGGKVIVELTDMGRQQVRDVSHPFKASWAASSCHRHEQETPLPAQKPVVCPQAV